MTKQPQRFAPVLRYLVEKDGMYTHPLRSGFTSGQEAWANQSLQFLVYANAKQHAINVGGEVVKLRIRATAEKFKSDRKQPVDLVDHLADLIEKNIRMSDSSLKSHRDNFTLNINEED